jgi:hypothetical protein
MILTTEQQHQLELAAIPLIKWLNENCHPHCEVAVDCGSAELKEGIARVVNEGFIE